MPTADDVDRALEEAEKLYANYAYLFDHIATPDWIKPLRDRGLFRVAPEPIVHPDGARSFPPWPESRYLVRMAPLAPELVFDVLKQIPETSNIYVHGDIVDAALRLPIDMRRALASREAAWVRRQEWLLWLLPDRYAELAKSLASEGAGSAARELLSAVLEVMPNGGGKMDNWDYRRVLEIARESVTRADATPTLDMLSSLLERAVRAEHSVSAESGRDYSVIWRRAVEDHDQNGDHSIADPLINALRDSADQAVQTNPQSLSGVIAGLEAKRLSIFRRIALYVLARHPQAAPAEARGRVADTAILNDPDLRHEYAQLAKSALSLLADDEQDSLFHSIATRFDEGKFRGLVEARFGRPPTGEELTAARERDELLHLALFEGALPGRWRARYEDLLTRHPRPDHADFPVYHEVGFVGPQSARTADELAAMPIEELLAFLRSWKPTGSFMSPSYEGLGRQLQEAVQREPDRYAPYSKQFAELEPTYVRLFVEGIDQGLRAGRPISDWGPVLTLCEAVVAEPRGIAPHFDDNEDRDLTWHWAQHSVARLLDEGLGKTGLEELPSTYAPRIWTMLGQLARDPDPTSDHEREYGGTNMDPLTMSLNVVRGTVMHAIVRYALWRRRAFERDSSPDLGRGFDAMPEVRDELEWHLDPDNDPSTSVRAVYGKWLPWLVLLDRGWTERNLARIFPEDPALRDAAWDAYLAYSPAYDVPFDVLAGEYRRAVEAMRAGAAGVDDRRGDPRHHVAAHFAAVFLRGRLTFESHDGLLNRFFQIAPPGIRGAMVATLGRIAYDAKALTEAQVARMQGLWQQRFEAVPDKQGAGGSEFVPFAWWYASGRVGEQWSLDRLDDLLTAGGSVDPGHVVLDRLAVDAPRWPEQVLRVLRQLIARPPDPWLFIAVSEELRAIVAAGRAAGGEPASLAQRAVDDLAARGTEVDA